MVEQTWVIMKTMKKNDERQMTEQRKDQKTQPIIK